MPVIIFFVAYSISAAIALYFFVSNLVAIVQEFYIKASLILSLGVYITKIRLNQVFTTKY